MRLLILGGLGPYPERIDAFVERGHQIWYACTTYLPHVQEHIPATPVFGVYDRSPEAVVRLAEWIEAERIDAIYSLLNAWDGSNWVTAGLLRHGCPAPVVRHYKEHYLTPTKDERVCLERSAGVIFVNDEARDYFAGRYRLPARTALLDADLLPRRYLAGRRQPKRSSADGRPHLLIAGSAMDDGGRYDYRALMRELAGYGAHVHLYGLFRRMRQSDGWLLEDPEVEILYRDLAAGSEYLHVHPIVPPARFVEEWSRYDAGLLHAPDPNDRFRTQNFPNRYGAYVAAGVPVALRAGEMPALQRHLEGLAAAVVHDDLADLVRRLPDPRAAAGALAARESVTFESTLPKLLTFIQSCLA